MIIIKKNAVVGLSCRSFSLERTKMEENNIRRLESGIILEDDSISTYDMLDAEIGKLLRNVEGLGKSESADKTEARKKGLEILKAKYPEGYKKLVRNIKNLSRQFIREYCFNVMFFQDAAESLLIDTPTLLKGYVSERADDASKAIFTDYSMDEFVRVADEIREKVVDLAMLNWAKHKKLAKAA